MKRNLPEWLSYISTQHHKEIALGLERSREVATRMDVLPLAAKQMIVAGTNGKGSTVRFAESLLLAQGFSVGLIMSPHLHRYNERVRLNGFDASDEQLIEAFEACESARGDIPLTYYEYSVLSAFWVFRQSRVDVCLLEVGLGGRLDTTNIVDAQVAAVTSIGLDHQSFLGDTLDLIGAEKAAVCRANRPLLLGAPMPGSVTQVAQETGAEVLTYGEHFWYQRSTEEVRLRLASGNLTLSGQLEPRVAWRNVALATAAVGQLTRPPNSAELAEAIDHCRHPGRFEMMNFKGAELLVDVAHNPASAEFLAKQLKARWPQRRFVACCGFLADKDVEGIVRALKALMTHWVIVPTEGPRGLSGESAAELSFPQGACSVEQDVESGLNKAHALAEEADIIVAFGSFAQVQRVRELILPEGASG